MYSWTGKKIVSSMDTEIFFTSPDLVVIGPATKSLSSLSRVMLSERASSW